MYRSLNLNEDLALKQVITDRFSLSTDRGFNWRDVLSTEKRHRSPTSSSPAAPPTPISPSKTSPTPSATPSPTSSSPAARMKTSIFSEVNRKFVSDVAHSVAAFLTTSLEATAASAFPRPISICSSKKPCSKTKPTTSPSPSPSAGPWKKPAPSMSTPARTPCPSA